MPLTVGSRLAHYDVTALIGEGGMGPPHAVDTEKPILSDRSHKPPIEPVEMGLGTVRTKAGQMVRERFADLAGVEVTRLFGDRPAGIGSRGVFADQASRSAANGT